MFSYLLTFHFVMLDNEYFNKMMIVKKTSRWNIVGLSVIKKRP